MTARASQRLPALVAGAAWAVGVAAQPASGPSAAHSGASMATPLVAQPGDVLRGRAIVASRQTGLCLLCHAAPIPEERFQGNLAPDLAGAGSRWSAGQLRLRLVDAQRLNPDSMMPSYYRTDGLVRVGAAWVAKPVLSAQQIEDVVSYLGTLRE